MSVQAQGVEVPVDGRSLMPAWWARPTAGHRPRGAVLVLPEVFGVNAWVRSVAERLAEEGYAALAISTFWRTAPHLDVGYDAAGLQVGRQHRDQVRADQLLLDVAAAVAWLGEQHADQGLADRPVGCVGFCFGGHLAMLAATLPQLAATCDFYGARVSDFRPPSAQGGADDQPTLALLPQIPGRIWCFCGDADPLMPAEEIQAIDGAIRAANAAAGSNRHRLVMAPGAGHGYMCEARADFHSEASRAGWQAMLELFAQEL